MRINRQGLLTTSGMILYYCYGTILILFFLIVFAIGAYLLIYPNAAILADKISCTDTVIHIPPGNYTSDDLWTQVRHASSCKHITSLLMEK